MELRPLVEKGSNQDNISETSCDDIVCLTVDQSPVSIFVIVEFTVPFSHFSKIEIIDKYHFIN